MKSCVSSVYPCCDGTAYEGCEVQDGNGIAVTTCICNTDLCNSTTSLTMNFVIIALFCCVSHFNFILRFYTLHVPSDQLALS